MDINILLFPDYETLDAMGPIEIFSHSTRCTLHYVSVSGGTITSHQGFSVETVPSSNVTEPYILLIPGGQGTRPLVKDATFLAHLRNYAQKAAYCLTVCTGSALLAATGLLDGKKATSNKRAMDWVKSVNTKVQWIEKARWVTDGTWYTSSGISAGMDMALGFISDTEGIETARTIAAQIEYVWNEDKTKDMFAK